MTTQILQGWNLLECGAEVKFAGDRPVEALVYYEDAPLEDAVIAAQIAGLTGFPVRLGGWTRATNRLARIARLEVQGESPSPESPVARAADLGKPAGFPGTPPGITAQRAAVPDAAKEYL